MTPSSLDPNALTRADVRLARLADHPLVGRAWRADGVGFVDLVADRQAGRSFPADRGVGARCVRFARANGLAIEAEGDRLRLPLDGRDPDGTDDLFDRLERSLDDTEAWSWAEGARAP